MLAPTASFMVTNLKLESAVMKLSGLTTEEKPGRSKDAEKKTESCTATDNEGVSKLDQIREKITRSKRKKGFNKKTR